MSAEAASLGSERAERPTSWPAPVAADSRSIAQVNAVVIARRFRQIALEKSEQPEVA